MLARETIQCLAASSFPEKMSMGAMRRPSDYLLPDRRSQERNLLTKVPVSCDSVCLVERKRRKGKEVAKELFLGHLCFPFPFLFLHPLLLLFLGKERWKGKDEARKRTIGASYPFPFTFLSLLFLARKRRREEEGMGCRKGKNK